MRYSNREDTLGGRERVENASSCLTCCTVAADIRGNLMVGSEIRQDRVHLYA